MADKFEVKKERLGARIVHVIKKGKWYFNAKGKRQQTPVGACFDDAEDAQKLARRLNANC